MPTKRARKTMRTRQSASRAASRSAKPPTSKPRLSAADRRERALIGLLDAGVPLDAQAMHDLDALEWMPKLSARTRRELRARARIQAVRDTLRRILSLRQRARHRFGSEAVAEAGLVTVRFHGSCS